MASVQNCERIDSIISVNEIDQARHTGAVGLKTLLHDKKQSMPIQEMKLENDISADGDIDEDDDDCNAMVTSDNFGS